MERHSQGTVDSLDFSRVLDQQQVVGTKVTIIVPTDVTGSTDSLSVITLKNQLRDAKNSLVAEGQTEAEVSRLLAPAVELLDDSSYWRLQSRSLVVFVADGFFQATRVPVELPASLTIGESFDMLPLAPVLASDRKLYVLALAKNAVRLFDTTRNVIEELPLENIPASFDDVIDELPERVVDVRAGSAGTHGTASFQGTEGDINRTLLEKYIRAVGHAVGERLGTARSQLLVLAAVNEYLPIFKQACTYPAIFDEAIAGNPEHLLPDQLRSAAWRLVNAHESAHEAEEEDHARSVAHAGKGSFDIAEIANAAEGGRVETLFLPRDHTQFVGEDVQALANRALVGTLKSSGALRTLGETESRGLATFRY